MKRILLWMLAIILVCSASAFISCSSDNNDNPVNPETATDYDQNMPFGFCSVSSRTDPNSIYEITGGGCYTYPVPEGFTGVVILKSDGQDMKNAIENAIKDSESKIIIFDGSNGDFIVSGSVKITTSDKTLIGINNARICSQWFLTDEIKRL